MFDLKEFERNVEKSLSLIRQIAAKEKARRRDKPLCELVNELEEEEKPITRCDLCPLHGRVSQCACRR